MHSNSHLGISLAAMTHLAAATPNLSYDCDTQCPWQPDEVIEGGKLRFSGGALAVPDGPGLGVTLGRAALTRLHQNYLTCGFVARDDESEMQKHLHGWTFKRPRFGEVWNEQAQPALMSWIRPIRWHRDVPER